MNARKLTPITWLGDSLDVVRAWPVIARKRAGEELFRLQIGCDPWHWRYMKTVGKGVREIKISEGGEYRVFYVVRGDIGIVVLHAFSKKRRRTVKADIEMGRRRLKLI